MNRSAIVLLILVIAFALVLFSCGNSVDDDKIPGTENNGEDSNIGEGDTDVGTNTGNADTDNTDKNNGNIPEGTDNNIGEDTDKSDDNDNDDSTLSYNVRFEPENGTSPFVVSTSGTIEEPESPKKKGYDFLGWYYEGSLWDFSLPISTDMTLYASWRIHKFQILYSAGDALNSAENPNEYTVESIPELIYPAILIGQDFDGWYFDSDFLEPYDPAKINGDVTLYAKFKINLQYELIDGGYYVTAYNGNSSLVTVPEIYEGIPVVGVKSISSKSIEKIVLPDTLKYISANAFDGCINLKYNSIGQANYIASYDNPYFALVSYKDSDASSVEIDNETRLIADGTFENCSFLEEIIGGEKVSIIGNRAFSDCESLAEILKSDALVEIGDNAFYNCHSLTAVSFAESLTKIGESAFAYCNKIKEVYIPNNIERIEDKTFFFCSDLELLVLGNGIKYISKNAFEDTNDAFSVYYMGSESEFALIELNGSYTLENAKTYYYSAIAPSENGPFWHYVDGVPKVWSSNPR